MSRFRRVDELFPDKISDFSICDVPWVSWMTIKHHNVWYFFGNCINLFFLFSNGTSENLSTTFCISFWKRAWEKISLPFILYESRACVLTVLAVCIYSILCQEPDVNAFWLGCEPCKKSWDHLRTNIRPYSSPLGQTDLSDGSNVKRLLGSPLQ